jgi:hypothetical protein
MLGGLIGFCKQVQKVNPNVVIIHCLLLRENSATRTIQPPLYIIPQNVIQIIHLIKSRILNSSIFNTMYDEMGLLFINLLYHSDIR